MDLWNQNSYHDYQHQHHDCEKDITMFDIIEIITQLYKQYTNDGLTVKNAMQNYCNLRNIIALDM